MIDFSDYVKVNISDDKMMASLVLMELPDCQKYTFDDIMEILQKEGVTAGIKEEIVRTMAEHDIYSQRVVVANGKEPEEGRDGCYDFKFRLKPVSSPKINPDGSVNYHELELFDSVEEGELVAEYIPKKLGTDGLDVRGEVIHCSAKKDLAPLKGKCIKVSEDGLKYYATVSGKISYSMGRILIDTVYTITEDVDLSTGNIDFKGDVDIMGKIAAGMAVNASGNVTVAGIVESATVTAGKNILVKKGILGGNVAKLTAGGNVVAQFIENAAIECNGDVQTDSLIHSDVKCYGSVVVHGKNGKILGGKVCADKMVYTRCLGSKSGVKTDVQVGIDLSLIMSRKEMEEKLDELKDELRKVEASIERRQKTAKDKMALMELVRTKVSMSSEISKMSAVFEEVTNRIKNGKDAEVIVEGVVYPGVSIGIDGKYTGVEVAYREIVFQRKDDRVLSRALEDEDMSRKNI